MNSTLSTIQMGSRPLHTNCMILFHSVALCFAISLALLCKMDVNAKQGTSLMELATTVCRIVSFIGLISIPKMKGPS